MCKEISKFLVTTLCLGPQLLQLIYKAKSHCKSVTSQGICGALCLSLDLLSFNGHH